MRLGSYPKVGLGRLQSESADSSSVYNQQLSRQLSMVTAPRYLELHSLDFIPETPNMGLECPNIQSPDEINRRPCKSNYRYQLECEGPESYGDC